MLNNQILQAEKLKKDRDIIQTSRILAQAKAVRKDGSIFVVAVYDMSTAEFFFFNYTAKTSRSPRRTWKLAGYSIVNDGRKYDPGGKGKLDLREYLSRHNYALQPGTQWKIRYPHQKAAFIQRFEQVGDPFRHGVFHKPMPAGATFIIAEWKATGRKPSKYREASLTVPKPINYNTGDKS